MAKKTISWSGWLVDNPLTEDPNDFTLKMKSENMVTTEDIAKALIAEGTEFKLETLIDILNRGDRIIREKLSSGISVGTGVFYAYPSVSGVWYGKDDVFNPEKHKVGINFQTSASLREELKTVSINILGINPAGPEISLVTDSWSGEVNSILTVGENVIIKGRNLSIAGEDEQNGICFRNTATDAVTRVDPRRITVNNPSQLIFRVPPLEAGDYWLEVTTQYSTKSTQTKAPRTVRFEKVLNVAQPEAEPKN